jgi:ribonucleoside-diphosphate reductase beta chain
VENIADKKLLNCPTTDPNQILPMKYHWARVHYKNGVANSWTPEEVNMQKDVEMWRSPDALTGQERRLVLRNMGFFSTAESLTANNIVLTIYRHITNPECRQYLLRQAYEEAVHTDTFIYCCDTLGLDPGEHQGQGRLRPRDHPFYSGPCVHHGRHRQRPALRA